MRARHILSLTVPAFLARSGVMRVSGRDQSGVPEKANMRCSFRSCRIVPSRIRAL